MPLFPLGILLIFGNRSYSRRCPLSGIGNVSAPFLPIPPAELLIFTFLFLPAKPVEFLGCGRNGGEIAGRWAKSRRPLAEKPQC